MIRRVIDFWFAERGIGKPSRVRAIFDLLTLGPIRRGLFRLGSLAFTFETPEWARKTQVRVWSGSNERISLFDWINPIRWLVWTLGFCFEWVASRRYYAYGPAVPAIVILLGAGLAFGLIVARRDKWRTQVYLELLKNQATANSGDNTLATIAVSRLLEREPERVDLRIQKAFLLEKIGQSDQARKEMETLYIQNQSSVAAYWLLQQDFRLAEVSSWTEQQHSDFRQLAKACGTPENEKIFVASRVLLAQYYMSIGAATEAVSLMESVAQDSCELQLICAALHSQLNNDDAAAQWAGKAQEGYRKMILADASLIDARLNLAKTLLIQGQHEAVVKTLSDGYKLTKNELLLTAGAEAFVAWAQRIAVTEKDSQAALIKRLQLLTRASELAPNHAMVVENLVTTVIKCADSDDPEVAKMRGNLVGKLDGEKAHFVQGTIDLMRGELQQAEQHLSLAMAGKNNVPGILNNLAVVMYQQENPNLDRALALVNAALKAVPNQPQIRETRGQILVRLKQYQDAVFDLEFALKAKEPAKPIHQSLAEAYEAMGLTDLAKTHLELAAQ